MNRLIFFIFIFIANKQYSQESVYFPLYFQFSSDSLETSERMTLTRMLKNLESMNIDSLKAIGFCDDIGTKKQNDSLSKNRANAVLDFIRKILPKDSLRIEEGIGKGMILYDPEIEEAQRIRNRRVDLTIYYSKSAVKKKDPINVNKETQQFFESAKIGDRLNLRIIFYGSSHKAMPQSDKSISDLYEMMKNSKVKIEIQGHICCERDTTKDGFDLETKTNDLSYNRAKEIYDQLVSRGISKDRMRCRGFGVRRPSGRGQDADRRVEIEIIENGERKNGDSSRNKQINYKPDLIVHFGGENYKSINKSSLTIEEIITIMKSNNYKLQIETGKYEENKDYRAFFEIVIPIRDKIVEGGIEKNRIFLNGRNVLNSEVKNKIKLQIFKLDY